jgi:hypothetical protein
MLLRGRDTPAGMTLTLRKKKLRRYDMYMYINPLKVSNFEVGQATWIPHGDISSYVDWVEVSSSHNISKTHIKILTVLDAKFTSLEIDNAYTILNPFSFSPNNEFKSYIKEEIELYGLSTISPTGIFTIDETPKSFSIQQTESFDSSINVVLDENLKAGVTFIIDDPYLSDMGDDEPLNQTLGFYQFGKTIPKYLLGYESTSLQSVEIERDLIDSNIFYESNEDSFIVHPLYIEVDKSQQLYQNIFSRYQDEHSTIEVQIKPEHVVIDFGYQPFFNSYDVSVSQNIDLNVDVFSHIYQKNEMKHGFDSSIKYKQNIELMSSSSILDNVSTWYASRDIVVHSHEILYSIGIGSSQLTPQINISSNVICGKIGILLSNAQKTLNHKDILIVGQYSSDFENAIEHKSIDGSYTINVIRDFVSSLGMVQIGSRLYVGDINSPIKIEPGLVVFGERYWEYRTTLTETKRNTQDVLYRLMYTNQTQDTQLQEDIVKNKLKLDTFIQKFVDIESIVGLFENEIFTIKKEDDEVNLKFFSSSDNPQVSQSTVIGNISETNITQPILSMDFQNLGVVRSKVDIHDISLEEISSPITIDNRLWEILKPHLINDSNNIELSQVDLINDSNNIELSQVDLINDSNNIELSQVDLINDSHNIEKFSLPITIDNRLWEILKPHLINDGFTNHQLNAPTIESEAHTFGVNRSRNKWYDLLVFQSTPKLETSQSLNQISQPDLIDFRTFIDVELIKSGGYTKNVNLELSENYFEGASSKDQQLLHIVGKDNLINIIQSTDGSSSTNEVNLSQSSMIGTSKILSIYAPILVSDVSAIASILDVHIANEVRKALNDLPIDISENSFVAIPPTWYTSSLVSDVTKMQIALSSRLEQFMFMESSLFGTSSILSAIDLIDKLTPTIQKISYSYRKDTSDIFYFRQNPFHPKINPNDNVSILIDSGTSTINYYYSTKLQSRPNVKDESEINYSTSNVKTSNQIPRISSRSNVELSRHPSKFYDDPIYPQETHNQPTFIVSPQQTHNQETEYESIRRWHFSQKYFRPFSLHETIIQLERPLHNKDFVLSVVKSKTRKVYAFNVYKRVNTKYYKIKITQKRLIRVVSMLRTLKKKAKTQNIKPYKIKLPRVLNFGYIKSPRKKWFSVQLYTSRIKKYYTPKYVDIKSLKPQKILYVEIQRGKILPFSIHRLKKNLRLKKFLIKHLWMYSTQSLRSTPEKDISLESISQFTRTFEKDISLESISQFTRTFEKDISLESISITTREFQRKVNLSVFHHKMSGKFGQGSGANGSIWFSYANRGNVINAFRKWSTLVDGPRALKQDYTKAVLWIQSKADYYALRGVNVDEALDPIRTLESKINPFNRKVIGPYIESSLQKRFNFGAKHKSLGYYREKEIPMPKFDSISRYRPQSNKISRTIDVMEYKAFKFFNQQEIPIADRRYKFASDLETSTKLPLSLKRNFMEYDPKPYEIPRLEIIKAKGIRVDTVHGMFGETIDYFSKKEIDKDSYVIDTGANIQVKRDPDEYDEYGNFRGLGPVYVDIPIKTYALNITRDFMFEYDITYRVRKNWSLERDDSIIADHRDDGEVNIDELESRIRSYIQNGWISLDDYDGYITMSPEGEIEVHDDLVKEIELLSEAQRFISETELMNILGSSLKTIIQQRAEKRRGNT